MKSWYKIFIIIAAFVVVGVLLFYLISTTNSFIKLANRNIAIDVFITKEINNTRNDMIEFKVDDSLFKTDKFKNLEDNYKKEDLKSTGIGNANIFNSY